LLNRTLDPSKTVIGRAVPLGSSEHPFFSRNRRGCVNVDKLSVRHQNNSSVEQQPGATGCLDALLLRAGRSSPARWTDDISGEGLDD